MGCKKDVTHEITIERSFAVDDTAAVSEFSAMPSVFYVDTIEVAELADLLDLPVEGIEGTLKEVELQAAEVMVSDIDSESSRSIQVLAVKCNKPGSMTYLTADEDRLVHFAVFNVNEYIDNYVSLSLLDGGKDNFNTYLKPDSESDGKLEIVLFLAGYASGEYYKFTANFKLKVKVVVETDMGIFGD